MALIFDPLDGMADVVAHAAGSLTLALQEARTAAPTFIAPPAGASWAWSCGARPPAATSRPSSGPSRRPPPTSCTTGFRPSDPPWGLSSGPCLTTPARPAPSETKPCCSTPGRSSPVSAGVLTAAQYAAYRRLANAVLADALDNALDRFAMG